MKNKSILIIGPLPEPKGGVSIHMQRLSKLMEESYSVPRIDESPIIKKNIFNIRSLNIFRYLKLIYQSDIVHVQSSIDILRIFHITLAKIFGKKVILTIHSWRNKSNKQKKLLMLCLNCVDKVIVVNKNIAVELKLKNYIVKPAFLPPDSDELNDIPKDLKDIVKLKKEKGFFIVSSNAYQLADHNGEDLYGLDMFIDLAECSRDKKIFFIFQLASLGGIDFQEKYKKYVKLIADQKIENILLYVKPISFVALINGSDMTLRLTNTDGDALSIRESLYLNTPIIASDVTERPEGTILFKSRDSDDLKQVFNQTYEDINSGIVNCSEETQDYRQSYVDFYNKIYFEQEKE